MNPREFYALAGELAKSRSRASIRSATSRAYYSAFHVGAEALRSLGFSLSKGSAAHGEVQRCRVNSGDATTIFAARQLSDLQSARIRADYQLDLAAIEDQANALRILKTTRGVIDAFDQIAASPRRSAIQSAIAAWRKSNGYP